MNRQVHKERKVFTKGSETIRISVGDSSVLELLDEESYTGSKLDSVK